LGCERDEKNALAALTVAQPECGYTELSASARHRSASHRLKKAGLAQTRWEDVAQQQLLRWAQLGQAEAQHQLAQRFWQQGGAEAQRKTYRWYGQAAAQDHALAEAALGWMYAKGIGTAPDEHQAMK
jgi:TPR repeat protein